MKVFVVLEDYHSYGDEFTEVFGVFSSEERAEDAIQKALGKEQYRRWHYTIMEEDVDGEIEQ